MVSIVLWGIPNRSRAMRLEAPKSMQNRTPGASTRKQALNRPPEPNESPEPTKVTLTDMRRFPYGLLLPGLRARQRRMEDDRQGNGQKHASGKADHRRNRLAVHLS